MDDLSDKYPKCNFVKLYCDAVKNNNSNNLEIAVMLCCIVIEAIATKKYNKKEVSIFDWLLKNKLSLDSNNINDIKNKYYSENTSCSEKFAKIIVDTYSKLKEYPDFLYKITDSIKINDIPVTHTSYYSPSEDDLKDKLNKEMKHIYGTYRSKFCHMGANLPNDTKLRTEHFFGISRPQVVTVQDILKITFDVINYYHNNIKNNSFKNKGF
jgi:hypothetical protein